jgi:hypothetical protein
MPLEFGDMGIQNLETFGWALRIRWFCAQKTDPTRPWAGLPIQVPRNAQALFDVAVDHVVGNGESTRIWSDRWLNGNTIAGLAPNLIQLIPKRVAKCRTVAQALHNRSWVADNKGAITVQILIEYLLIWDQVDGIFLQPDVQDQYRWEFSQSGTYSSKSAYAAFLRDMSVPLLGEEFGKVGLCCAANFSYGWLSTSDVGQ